MTNRFTKTSPNVRGGIMRPPSDGGLKSWDKFILKARQSSNNYTYLGNKIQLLTSQTFRKFNIEYSVTPFL